MSGFIDFGELKLRVNIEQAAQMLGLVMKPAAHQLRGVCPACKGTNRQLVITPAKGAFYCFGASAGGDLIALVAHAKGIAVKEAAAFIAEAAGIGTGTSTVKSTVRQTEPEPTRNEKGLQPLAYLKSEHEAVEAIGFDPAVAKRLGIGYAPKGIMRGTVAVPVRDEHGVLQGYIGITEAKLPADFTLNVVRLKTA